MLGSKNGNSNGKLVVLKIKTKDAEDKAVPPYFSVSRKVDGKFKEVAQENRFGGRLKEFKLEKYTWEEQENDVIKVFLEDEVEDEDTGELEKETYLLDLRFNLLSRNLLNTLVGLSKGDYIDISLYEKTSKKDGKVYPAISVWKDGELAQWKFRLEELPPVAEVKVGKKVVRDYEELNSFYLAAIEKFNAQVVTEPVAEEPKSEKKSKKNKAKAAANLDDAADEEENDGVPF